jgi:hypothetical protein
MPVSVATLPGAVEKAGERGIRKGIRKEVNRLTRPTTTFATGATLFLITYAMQRRWQRLRRMESKLDRLDEKTDALPDADLE